MFRTMMIAMTVGSLAAVGCVASSDASTDETAVAQNSGGGFTCLNKASITGVECIGSIAVLPINVDVKNVGVLNGAKLDVLSNDLNNLSIKDVNILDNNKILDDVGNVTVTDFLNKFLINVSNNDVDVCTTVLGLLFCK
jgi:hypothetical protein